MFWQWLARHIRWTVALTARCDVLLFWGELFYYESFGLFAVLILVQLAATGAAAFRIYNKGLNFMSILQTIDLKKYYGTEPNITHALITKPAIVLADEPTGNLDSKTSAEVLGLIKRTSAEFRQTVVMITHNNDIARLADRIVRIEDGKIVE